MVSGKLDRFVRWSLLACMSAGAQIVVGCTDDDSSVGDGTGSESDGGGGSDSGSAGSMSASGASMTAGSASMTGGGDSTGGSTDGGTAADSTDGSSGGTAADTSGGGDESGSSSGDGDSGSSSDGAQNNDDGPPELCEAPGSLITCDAAADSPTIFNALGLGCDGGADEAIPIINEGFNQVDPGTWAIASQFGTYIDPVSGEPFWGPREGDSFLVLSSGQVGTPDASGALPAQGGDNSANPDAKPLPAPMSPLPGSGGAPFVGCDGVNDCSDSLQAQWIAGDSEANDLIWFQFASQVPGGTHGFSIDFAYFSSEFPEWVGSEYNDMFVVWSNSETYTGNLCFVDDQPCTVTALWPTQFQDNNPPELAGTGFGFDGATGWFQIKGSAEPLELVQLTFAVFDMGDTVLDTYVILDNFQWDCEGCTPTEVNPCGVVDPV